MFLEISMFRFFDLVSSAQSDFQGKTKPSF